MVGRGARGGFFVWSKSWGGVVAGGFFAVARVDSLRWPELRREKLINLQVPELRPTTDRERCTRVAAEGGCQLAISEV